MIHDPFIENKNDDVINFIKNQQLETFLKESLLIIQQGYLFLEEVHALYQDEHLSDIYNLLIGDLKTFFTVKMFDINILNELIIKNKMKFYISESKALQYLYFIEKYPISSKFYCELSLKELEKYIIEDATSDKSDKNNTILRDDINFTISFDFLSNIFISNQELIKKVYEVGDIKASCRITSFFRSDILQKDLLNLVKYLINNLSKDIHFSKNKISFESQNFLFLRNVKNISHSEENSLKASRVGIKDRILKIIQKFTSEKESYNGFSFSKYYSRTKSNSDNNEDSIVFNEYGWVICSIINMINMVSTLIDEFSVNLKDSSNLLYKDKNKELINLIEDFSIVKKDFEKLNKNFLTDCQNKIFEKEIENLLNNIICGYESESRINPKIEDLVLDIKFNIGICSNLKN